jgi:hypothetical protein
MAYNMAHADSRAIQILRVFSSSVCDAPNRMKISQVMQNLPRKLLLQKLKLYLERKLVKLKIDQSNVPCE